MVLFGKQEISEKKERTELFIVVLIAISVRFAIAFGTGGIHYPQVFEYEELANNILKGNGFVGVLNGTLYYSMMTPFYSYLNAAVYYVTGNSQMAMLSLQIVISGFCSLFVVKIGRCLMKPPAPFLAGLMVSFYPTLIIYSSTKIHEVNLVIFFVLLNIYLIFSALNKFSYLKIIYISIIFAVAILTRATLVFSPFLLLILIKGTIRRKAITASLLMVFCFSFILMWNYRNYRIHGKFAFTTTASFNLYMGNNEDSTGTEFARDKRSIRSVILEKNEVVKTMDEVQQYGYFKDRAIEFITQNPLRFLILTIKRVYYFWWFSPYTGIEYPQSFFLIYKIFYICMLVFASFGITDSCLFRTNDQKQLLFIILCTSLIICFLQSMVYVHYRHRVVIELLVVIFAANGICHFIRYIVKQLWFSKFVKLKFIGDR